MTKDLEDGFYWVRRGETWTIAELERTDEGSYWWAQGRNWWPSDFDEIDPRPIKREAA